MKWEANHNKESEKHVKTWRLNNILLNNEWVNNEIIKEIKRCLENENTKPPNLLHTVKAVLRGKFIAFQASFKTQEKSHKNSNFTFKEKLKKQAKSKVSKRNQIKDQSRN